MTRAQNTHGMFLQVTPQPGRKSTSRQAENTNRSGNKHVCVGVYSHECDSASCVSCSQTRKGEWQAAHIDMLSHEQIRDKTPYYTACNERMIPGRAMSRAEHKHIPYAPWYRTSRLLLSKVTLVLLPSMLRSSALLEEKV